MLKPIGDVDSFVEATRILPFVHDATQVSLDVVLSGPGLEEGIHARTAESIHMKSRPPQKAPMLGVLRPGHRDALSHAARHLVKERVYRQGQQVVMVQPLNAAIGRDCGEAEAVKKGLSVFRENRAIAWASGRRVSLDAPCFAEIPPPRRGWMD